MDGFKNSTKTQYSMGGYAKGGPKGAAKIGKVMGEFKSGALHSGSKKGPEVTNPKQAVAIALSEARKAGARIPMKKATGGEVIKAVGDIPGYGNKGFDRDTGIGLMQKSRLADPAERAASNAVRPAVYKAHGGPVKRTKTVPVAAKGPMLGAKKQMGGMASSIRTNPDLNKQDRRFVEDRAAQMRDVVGKPMKKGGMSC